MMDDVWWWASTQVNIENRKTTPKDAWVFELTIKIVPKIDPNAQQIDGT